MSEQPQELTPTRVVWTRGKGCRQLAELLAGEEAPRVQGDAATACVAERAELLVARRLSSSFDLVDTVVPVDLPREGVEAVVAAVGGGPHSVLAARIAERLGSALGVPAAMVAAYPQDASPDRAVDVVEEIYPQVPEIEYRTMEATDMGDLVSRFEVPTLLVFGAPGGSWLQRRLFGPGARLRSNAPTGAVMVQSAPRRVFQVMGEPVFVAPMLHAADTLRIRPESILAVADGGRLVGVVRRSRLAQLDPAMPVGEAMEDAVSIGQVEPVEAAVPLRPLFGEDPIPVVDDDERLVGGLAPPAA